MKIIFKKVCQKCEQAKIAIFRILKIKCGKNENNFQIGVLLVWLDFREIYYETRKKYRFFKIFQENVDKNGFLC